MSILLDRLIGYDLDDLDDMTGKTKIGIHPFLDAIMLRLSGWPGAPTNEEMEQAFKLKNQPFDVGGKQADDLALLLGLPAATGAAHRSTKEVEAILRLAEQFPLIFTKERVEQMLGISLSKSGSAPMGGAGDIGR